MAEVLFTDFIRFRLRLLKEEPYTQKDAEAAAGLTTDNGRVNKAIQDVPMAEAVVQEPKAAAGEEDQEVYDAFFSAY